jgi:hypothetical protein
MRQAGAASGRPIVFAEPALFEEQRSGEATNRRRGAEAREGGEPLSMKGVHSRTQISPAIPARISLPDDARDGSRAFRAGDVRAMRSGRADRAGNEIRNSRMCSAHVAQSHSDWKTNAITVIDLGGVISRVARRVHPELSENAEIAAPAGGRGPASHARDSRHGVLSIPPHERGAPSDVSIFLTPHGLSGSRSSAAPPRFARC